MTPIKVLEDQLKLKLKERDRLASETVYAEQTFKVALGRFEDVAKEVNELLDAIEVLSNK
jgi:hypothetical protein